MNFYEVLADGYHSPLTKTQIAELFQAGRLGRHHPCKQLDGKAWRTIDELFPLLKYETSTISMSQDDGQSAKAQRTRILMLFLFMAPATAGALLWFCFASNAVGRVERADPTASNWPKIISPAAAAPPSDNRARAGQKQATPEQVNRTATLPVNSAAALRETIGPQAARFAQGRLDVDQKQREQNQAEQIELERRKALGRDVVVLLDQFTVVHDVGESSVTLKIHDEDVATLDVWINSSFPVRLSKQKGITGSGTDETLIYTNSRARLYYVWEISGRLNHCRLRVRDK